MAKPSKPKRVSASFKLRIDVLERFRTHIRNEAGRPLFLTQSDFLESAIEREIERNMKLLEAQGIVVPNPSAPIVAGRKMGNHLVTTCLNNQSVTR